MQFKVITRGLLFFILIFWNSTLHAQSKVKYKYKTGVSLGYKYIQAEKWEHGRRCFEIKVTCNHYLLGVGEIVFVGKSVYNNGKFVSTYHLIKDSVFFVKLNYSKRQYDNFKEFTKVNDEELMVLKEAFNRFPLLANEYHLDSDTFKKYLGWFESYRE